MLGHKNNIFNIIAVDTMSILLSLYLPFSHCAFHDIFASAGPPEYQFLKIEFLVCKLNVVTPSWSTIFVFIKLILKMLSKTGADTNFILASVTGGWSSDCGGHREEASGSTLFSSLFPHSEPCRDPELGPSTASPACNLGTANTVPSFLHFWHLESFLSLFIALL